LRNHKVISLYWSQ